MVALSKARAWILSGCAALSLAAAFPVSARAEVLFDSLSSPNTGVRGDDNFGFNLPFDATFTTGASAFHATDIALLLNQAGAIFPGDDFTVSLHGGVPLEDVTFDPFLGLSVTPNEGPILGSVTLPISDLSTSLAVEHFDQFASIPLQPNSLYWIDLNISGPMTIDGPGVGWGTTSHVSGVGVAGNYNSSNSTDFAFFRNQGVSPFAFDVAFQMEVSGVAAPEPSTWILMLAGFAGLGLLGHRRRNALAASRA
jgi:hypothetical protein